MALPGSAEETVRLCRVLREAGMTPLIMGKGTNLLVTDAPLSRFVVRLGEGMSVTERRGETELFAQSGTALSRLAAAACAQGLAGLEFAHGIPGSLGGAVSMNAGAYGGEIEGCWCAPCSIWTRSWNCGRHAARAWFLLPPPAAFPTRAT
jgi:UDP-N-acetylmuramate dehydrogenase